MVYVSVNAHTIRANARHGRNDPPIRIARTRTDKKPRYAREIELVGKARVLYSREAAILSCGARMVIEAEDVKILK